MDNDAKLRPLYLAKILYEQTDEEHFLTTAQLIQILKDMQRSTQRQRSALQWVRESTPQLLSAN